MEDGQGIDKIAGERVETSTTGNPPQQLRGRHLAPRRQYPNRWLAVLGALPVVLVAVLLVRTIGAGEESKGPSAAATTLDVLGPPPTPPAMTSYWRRRLPVSSGADRAFLLVCGPHAGPSAGVTSELPTLPRLSGAVRRRPTVQVYGLRLFASVDLERRESERLAVSVCPSRRCRCCTVG